MSESFTRKIEELTQRIRGLPRGRVLAVPHRNADMDSVVSASLLRMLIQGMRDDLGFGAYFPEGVSKKAKSVLNLLEIESDSDPEEAADYEVAVFLDVGGPGVLGDARDILDESVELWLIDHHIPDDAFVSSFDFALVERDKVTSTCEILYHACVEEDIKLETEHKRAVLATVLVESRFLRNARCSTLDLVSEFCNGGVTIEDSYNLLTKKRDISSRLAVLKGLKRMTMLRSGDWVAAFSKVGAFQSRTANNLISAGADIAVVGDDVDGGCKVNIRTSNRFVSELSETAGKDIVDLLVESFGGEGGGHPSAAAAQVEGQLSDVYRTLEKHLEALFYSATHKKALRVE